MSTANTPYELARSFLGQTEFPGHPSNPKIMEMFRAVGHEWVKDDSTTAWCAAFVGYCLEKKGIRSTRLLTARSYLTFGVDVHPDDAREGDIAVFSRGKEAWQGHVAFFVSASKTHVKVLGGNQSDAVSIASYPISRLLGIRRVALEGNPTPTVKSVQEQLRALGYFEVGMPDGRYGPRTRAAILAFRADNSLPLSPEIDAQLEKALTSAPPRAVAPERAAGKPEGSRIMKAANVQIVTGVVGGATAVAANLAPAVENAERANGLVKRTFDLLHLDALLGSALPWVLGGVCAVVIVYAIATKMARIEDHQTGRTP